MQQRMIRVMASALIGTVAVLGLSASLSAQVTARIAPDITPAWSDGIQPINQVNYWNAVECGKQGGANPPCVFYDTGICENDQFALSIYTPYKQVAYEAWLAVRKGQDAPTPSYSAAQRQQVTLGVTRAKGSSNVITAVVVKRGGATVTPISRALDAPGGSFTFDFPAFEPTADITIEMTGKTGTVSCAVPKGVLTLFR